MKHVLFALALLMPVNAALAADTVGLTTLSVPAAHHGRDIKMAVMYPAEGGTETVLGENPVFFGTAVNEHAKPLPGKHPVILCPTAGAAITSEWAGWVRASRQRGPSLWRSTIPTAPPETFSLSKRPQPLDAGPGFVGGIGLCVERSGPCGSDRSNTRLCRRLLLRWLDRTFTCRIEGALRRL